MKLKTFIKWSGNKSKHLRHLIPHVPKDFNTYIEPFVGSGALLLALQPISWVINDINKDLVNSWIQLQKNPGEILDFFNGFSNVFKPMAVKDKVLMCKELTSKIESFDYDSKRASIYMLMKFCVYNGHIFTKNKFYFGGLDMHIYLQNRYFFLEEKMKNNLIEVSKYLNKNNNCKIYNIDYKEVLKKAKSGDFVFLDPPYIEDHNYGFNYNKDENIDINFIKELYKEVCILDNKKIKWMMTQADTHDVHKIFKKYKIVKFKVYRSRSNKYIYELLIMNY